MLAVVNVGEDELDTIPAAEARVAAELNDAGDNVEVIGMCVQLEAEAATIDDPDERAEMLEGFGLGEGALFRMVRSAYHLLGLRTFLTTGDKESRAWTFYERLDGPAVRRAHPHRLPARLHPGRGDPVGRAARASARGPRPRSSARSASRARTTSPSDGDVMEFRFNV